MTSPIQNIPDCFYRVSVKALVHNSIGKFLLIRSENGHWDLPGGGIDFGESHEEALRREIREEMGLDIEKIQPQPVYFYTAKGMNKDFYVANIVYAIILNGLDFTPTSECLEIGFFGINEAKLMNIYPKTREFLKHYKAENHDYK